MITTWLFSIIAKSKDKVARFMMKLKDIFGYILELLKNLIAMQMVKYIMVQTYIFLSELIPKRGHFVDLNVHFDEFYTSECMFPVKFLVLITTKVVDASSF